MAVRDKDKYSRGMLVCIRDSENAVEHTWENIKKRNTVVARNLTLHT